MNELTSEWEMERLGKLCSKIGSGATPRGGSNVYQSNGIPFIRSMNIHFNEFKYHGLVFINQSQADKLKAARVKENDVLLNITGASIGRVTLAPSDMEGARVNQHVTIIRPFEDIVPNYIRYFLASPKQQALILERGSGTTRQALTKEKIENFNIPIPPFSEQKRIVDKLDTLLARVDACRARLERVRVILKDFRQAVLAAATSGELTEDLHKDDKPWRKCKLGSLLADIRYGTSKKCSYELKNGSPVLRIPNIHECRIDPTDIKYGKFNKQEIQKLALKTGDLLLIRSNGSLGLVGKVAIVEPEFEGYLFAGYLIRLRVDTSIIMPSYLSLYLSSPKIRKHIELTARSTNGINNINSKEIQAIKIEIPPSQEQHEIIRRVEGLLAYADQLERHAQVALTKIKHLTPALLDKAFRGELVPQEPNDEPASVLLERIRAERARQPDKPKRTRRTKRSKMTKNSVKKAILELPEDHFSSDELRDHVAGDYEKLKDIIFALLNESEPSITQLFDEASQTIHFVRRKK